MIYVSQLSFADIFSTSEMIMPIVVLTTVFHILHTTKAINYMAPLWVVVLLMLPMVSKEDRNKRK